MTDNRLERSISRIEEKIDSLRSEIHANRVEDAAIHAEQNNRIANLEERANGISRKVMKHEDAHWRFLIGTTGLIGIIMAAAKWLGAYG